ncbi:MAG: metallopeptidase family protein [Dehalococcoidales bacterium]|nr:metallopeptidase family protein [Dehalococcoidales bacterium]MDD4323092.1 metallopeptidase family protein [Dehalococcoidales bacterium]MDD4794744.1 metallopeptidase family protein [Dehalococcoidales bacterium]MDD5122144.1 metallopeptidase family protein [Dehalococcoidales bacterium]MDD5498844.1 metallopeptidase family protein [Dehalococcoidales bacterium]
MKRERFEELVRQAIDQLPLEFALLMENVDVCVEDFPHQPRLTELGMGPGEILLGLYEGVPLTERGQSYSMTVPDKITLFKRPIEQICRNDEYQIICKISQVVRHEVAHHFGISDQRLEELEEDFE